MTEKKLWEKLGIKYIPISIEGQIHSLRDARNNLVSRAQETGKGFIQSGKLIGEINVLLDKLTKAM